MLSIQRNQVTAIMIAASLALLVIAPVYAQPGWISDDRPKITVNGEAVVNVKPDKIIVTFGIETWDSEILAAKQKNNDVLRQALEAISALEIPEENIQTDHLSIEPRYKSDYRKEDFIGYFVRNTFVVTLAEADKLEQLVTQALQAGVNFVHGVDFQTTEFKKHREQSRTLALKAAKEKAVMMASTLGHSVGAPLQISENFSGSPWRYYSSWSGWGHGRSQGMSQNVMQNVQSGTSESLDTIALGTISIRSNVTVTFELTEQIASQNQ